MMVAVPGQQRLRCQYHSLQPRLYHRLLQESLGKLSGQSPEKMPDSMKYDFETAIKALKNRAK